MSEPIFFSEKGNQTIIDRFITKIKSLDLNAPNNIELKEKILAIEHIAIDLTRQPLKYDQTCRFTAKATGPSLIKSMDDFDRNHNNNIDIIISDIYKIASEYTIYSDQEGTDIRILRSKNLIEKISATLNEGAQAEIEWARLHLPSVIIRQMLSDNEIKSFSDFSKTIETAKQLKQKWDEETNQKESRLIEIKAKLDGYEAAFNFVGLYNGFKKIHREKLFTSRLQLTILAILSALIISPLYIEFRGLLELIKTESIIDIKKFITFIPLIGIEIILIYFFRVCLSIYNSMCAQITQIELRMTLCEFIQSYANYAQEIKKTDPNALKKFEDVIFSGLVTDPNNIPSTFDGLEQISSIIKSVRGQSQ